jgi:hypothetical protein
LAGYCARFVVWQNIRTAPSMRRARVSGFFAAGAAVTRHVDALLFGVRPLDLTTFISVSLLLAAVTTLWRRA